MWPWIAANYSPHSHQYSANAIFRNCINGILWTTWVVLALWCKTWRDPFLIKLNCSEQQVLHALTKFFSVSFEINLARSSAKSACGRNTRITRSEPCGNWSRYSEIRWRSCRDTRWRVTDPPTDLFTINPIFGAALSPVEFWVEAK